MMAEGEQYQEGEYMMEGEMGEGEYGYPEGEYPEGEQYMMEGEEYGEGDDDEDMGSQD